MMIKGIMRMMTMFWETDVTRRTKPKKMKKISIKESEKQGTLFTSKLFSKSPELNG